MAREFAGNTFKSLEGPLAPPRSPRLSLRRHRRAKGPLGSEDGDDKPADVVEGMIDFGAVSLTGVHALQSFSLRNLCDYPNNVHLATTLGPQVTFQLLNENLSDPDNFNDLFNYIDLITDVRLQAHEVRQLVALFLPEEGDDSSLSPHFEDDDVDSHLHLFHHKPREMVGQLLLTVSSSDAVGEDVSASDGPGAGFALPVMAATVRAKVGQSVMHISSSELALQFSNCILGRVYNHELTIWNRSEFPVRFAILEFGNSELLRFSDYNSSEDVREGDVAPASYTRIRVAFTPRALGDLQLSFSICNLNALSNRFSASLQAMVVAAAQTEMLQVDALLDFGNCYVGTSYVQRVNLRNMHDQPLELDLQSAVPTCFSFHMLSNVKTTTDENRCSELSMQPGEHMQLALHFRPETASPAVVVPPGGQGAPPSAALLDKTYHCGIRATARGSDTPMMRAVTCKASVCESFIRLSTLHLAFGEMTIGAEQTLPLEIKNLSHLPASVKVHVLSKIIRLTPRALDIPALQTRDVLVTLAPDVLEPDLHKLVTFINLKNRANDQALVVSANIIDHGGIALHSNLYAIIAAGQHKAIDFGNVPLNSRTLTTLTLKNNTAAPLTLSLQSSRADMVLCTAAISEDRVATNLQQPLRHKYFVQMVHEHLESQSQPPTTTSAAEDCVGAESFVNTSSGNTHRDMSSRNGSSTGVSPVPSAQTLPAAASANSHPEQGGHLLGSNLSRRLPSTVPRPSVGSSAVAIDAPVSRQRTRLPAAPTTRGTGNGHGGGGNRYCSGRQSPSRVSAYLDLEVPATTNHAGADSRSARDTVRSPLLVARQTSLDLGSQAGYLTPLAAAHSANSLDSAMLLESTWQGTGNLLEDETYEDEEDQGLPSFSLPFSKQLSRPSALSGLGLAGGEGGGSSTLHSPVLSSSTVEQDMLDLSGQFTNQDTFVPHHFGSVAAEEDYVAQVRARQIRLHRAVQTGSLAPLSGAIIVPAKGRVHLFLVFRPDETTCSVAGSRTSKISGEIQITPEVFDPALADASWPLPLPAYPLPVFAKVCRLSATLPQKHFHFGRVKVQELRQCSLIVRNTSQLPFFYKLQKSGSTASGDFQLGAGRLGIIAPYKSRELNIHYQPGMAGLTAETLVIQNIFDPEHSPELLFKAHVWQDAHFSLTPQAPIELGTLPATVPRPATFTLHLANVSSRPRRFALLTEPLAMVGLQLATLFELVGTGSVLLSDEAELKVAKYEQKKKIAVRKQQWDKLKKYEAKIRRLRAGEHEDDVSVSESDDDSERSPSTERNKAPAFPFKGSLDSIVFLVPAMRTQQISVLCVVAPIQSASDVPVAACPFAFRVVAHEVRNTEVLQAVTVSGTLAIEKTTASQSSAGQVDRQAKQNLSPKEVSFLASARAAAIAGPPKKSIPPPRLGSRRPSINGRLTSSTTAAAASPSSSRDGVAVTMPLIASSLTGPLEVNPSTVTITQPTSDHGGTAFINVTNVSSQPIRFLVLQKLASSDQSLQWQCDPRGGRIAPHASVKVRLTAQSRLPGVRHMACMVRDLCTMRDTSFTLRVEAPVPELVAVEGVGCSPYALDFGLCYVTASSSLAKVESFVLRSLAERPLRLSCSSNLAHQVQIFSDVGLTVPFRNVQIEPDSCLTVYVALQPNIPESVLVSGQCRQLEGGIHVHVAEAEGQEVYSVTVRLRACVGMSILRLSKKFHKLGSTTQLGHVFVVNIDLLNVSARLPLDFELDPPSDVHCSALRGTIEAGGSHALSLTMNATAFGLTRRGIPVRNLHNPDGKLEITILYFLDPEVVSSNLPAAETSDNVQLVNFGLVYASPISGCLRDATELTSPDQTTHKTPWSDWYVLAGLDEAGHIERPGPTRSFVLENRKRHPISLLPRSDVSVRCRWGSVWNDQGDLVAPTDQHAFTASRVLAVEAALSAKRQGANWTTEPCGDVLYLPPHWKVQVTLSCPQPHRLSRTKWDRLSNGSVVRYLGIVLLENVAAVDASEELNAASDHRVLKMFNIQTTFGHSIGEADPVSLDLGSMGYSNAWAAEPFDFQVTNRSAVPLYFCFEALPPCVYGLQCTDSQSAEVDTGSDMTPALQLAARELRLAPYSAIGFRAMLDPRELEQLQLPSDNADSMVECTLLLRNNLNPLNRISMALRCHLVTFPLRFPDLQLRQELVLPSLTFPFMPEPVNSWFTVAKLAGKPGDTEFVHFLVTAELRVPFEGMFAAQIVTRGTSNPVSDFTLLNRDEKQLRVLLLLKEQDRVWPPTSLLAEETARPGSTCHVGDLCFRALHSELPSMVLPTVRLPIKAAFSAKSALEVSLHRLRIYIRPNRERLPVTAFTLTNRSSLISAEYRVACLTGTGPDDQPQHHHQNIRLEPARGVLAPLATQTVDVTYNGPATLPDRQVLLVLVTDTLVPRAAGEHRLPLELVPEEAMEDESDSDEEEVAGQDVPELDLCVGHHEAAALGQGMLNPPALAMAGSSVSWPGAAAVEAVGESVIPGAGGRDSPPAVRRGGGRIVLSHCKAADIPFHQSKRSYFINVGSHEQSTSPIRWYVVLENPGEYPLGFQASLVQSDDWLVLNESTGVLPPHNKPVRLRLNLYPTVVGIYYSHLIIRNLNNVSDVKVVQVHLEVVAPAEQLAADTGGDIVEPFKLRVPWVFSMGEPGVLDERIDFGNIFYGQVCSRHSFLIENASDQMLHFSLNSSVAADPRVELCFTTSFRSPPVLVERLAVPSGQHIRVFIRLLLLYRDPNQDPAPESVPLADSYGQPIRISVTCRSVRHNHRIIWISGQCRAPHLEVSTLAVIFQTSRALEPMGAATRPGAAGRRRVGVAVSEVMAERAVCEVTPAINTVLVAVQGLEGATFSLKSDSIYFAFSANVLRVEPGAPVTVRIEPRLDVIVQDLPRLNRTLYTQEYLSIYNAVLPSERHRVVISLRLGHMPEFQAYPRGPLRTTLSLFEARISELLSAFHAVAERGELQQLSMASTLYLDYHYIVDELIDFGLLLRSSSDNLYHLQVAILLFTMLFEHPTFREFAPAALRVPGLPAYMESPLVDWPPHLQLFVCKFYDFLHYFTNKTPAMLKLQCLFGQLLQAKPCLPEVNYDEQPPAAKPTAPHEDTMSQQGQADDVIS